MIDNDIKKLNPRTRIKVQVLLDVSRNFLKKDVYVFEARRSQDRQYQLYGYGRNATACKKAGVPVQYAKPKEKTRTWTLQSNHLIGKAVDIVFDLNKDPKIYKPSWNGDYSFMIKAAQYIGLRNLAPLETCHFEDNNISIESVMKKNSALWNQPNSNKDLLSFINTSFRKYL